MLGFQPDEEISSWPACADADVSDGFYVAVSVDNTIAIEAYAPLIAVEVVAAGVPGVGQELAPFDGVEALVGVELKGAGKDSDVVDAQVVQPAL